MKTHIRNIKRVYNQAKETHILEGKNAYRTYHNDLITVSESTGISFPACCAAFAALSPGVRIEENYKTFYLLVSFVKENKNPSDLNKVSYTGYSACRERAYNYLTGYQDFLTSLSKNSNKIRNFYNNVLNPDKDDYITIDRHMISIYLGRDAAEKERKQVFDNAKQYRIIADVYKYVAKKLNILPCELQAICWFAWRDRNAIPENSPF
jgi:hypothetical protein